MFSVLQKYEDRLARAEANQIESLRIMKKLELEADKVRDLVSEVLKGLDGLLTEDVRMGEAGDVGDIEEKLQF